MGSFINHNMTRYRMGNRGAAPRNCLTGFPVLVFLGIADNDSASSTQNYQYYFLGIYNFNLGRDSKFNLGHANIEDIPSLYKKPQNITETGEYLIPDGMSVTSITKEENQYANEFLIAEISGNDAHWDFSQWHKSILFSIDTDENNKVDTTFMFDDIKTRMPVAYQQSILSKFVEGVAKAGGYCFNYIGKTFNPDYSKKYAGCDVVQRFNEDGTPAKAPVVEGSDDEKFVYDYYPNNTVPDFRYQYRRSMSGGINVYDLDTKLTDAEAFNPSNLNDLLFPVPEGETQVSPMLDLRSAVEYYVICMAFGLVDSVQKNMNVKTWDNGKNWYIAFYDMDTCLGVNNAGAPVNYFCFSDYWHGNIDESSTSDYVIPGSINIYRDYSPEGDARPVGFSGYDTPSSYLFAIAKYAAITTYGENTLVFPASVWADYRADESYASTNKVGVASLASADKFIDDYYKGHMEGIDPFLWNLNYRTKYFIQEKDTSGNVLNFSDVNIGKFNGRRIERVRNWLSGRFRLLDAYFNLPATQNNIQVYNPADHTWSDYSASGANGSLVPIIEKTISEEQKIALRTNTNVEILRDIFTTSETGKQYSINLTAQIKTLPLSPLLLRTSNKITGRYLFEAGGDTTYQINIKTDSNQFLTLMGSSTWTHINDMSAFMTEPMTISSKYLQTVYANRSAATISNWNLDTPNLRTLRLLDSWAAGSISNIKTVNGVAKNVLPNLQTVDISGSQINLELSESNVTSVNASNIKASTMTITNNPMLTSFKMDNANLDTLTMSPVPSGLYNSAGEFIISSSWRIKNISITGMGTPTTDKYTLRINNNSTIETLAVTGFNKIIITNCENLKEIRFTNNKDDLGTLKTLYIVNSGKVLNKEKDQGLRIGPNVRVSSADNSDAIEIGVIYLRDYFNLKHLCFGSTLGFDRIVMPGCTIAETDYVKLIEENTYNTAEAGFAAQNNAASSYWPGIALDTYNGNGCFNGTNLKYLDCAASGNSKSLVITGASTFRRCPSFMHKTSKNSPISFRFNTTTLSEAFGCDASANANIMNLARAEKIMAMLNTASNHVQIPGNTKTDISSIVTLYRMFAHQTGIVMGPSSANRDKFDLSKFVNLTTINDMFAGTNVTYLNRGMLTYGDNVSRLVYDSPLYGGATTYYIDVDAFKHKSASTDSAIAATPYFIQRVTELHLDCNTGSTQYTPYTGTADYPSKGTGSLFEPGSLFSFMDASGTLIVPINCTSFSGFDINSKYKINVRSMFNGWANLKTLSWVFTRHDHPQGVWGLEKLFNYYNPVNKRYNGPKLETIECACTFRKVFNEDTLTQAQNGADFTDDITWPTQRVDIENLFKWDDVKNLARLFSYNAYEGSTGGYFAFPKKVMGISKLNSILQTIFGTGTRVQHWNKAFRDLHIIEPASPETTIIMVPNGVKNTMLQIVYSMFYNWKLYSKDTSGVAPADYVAKNIIEYPLVMDPDVCAKLTNTV